jgi:hypothetical protein
MSSSVVISTICPLSRWLPSVASDAIHASSGIFKIAARTCSVSP